MGEISLQKRERSNQNIASSPSEAKPHEAIIPQIPEMFKSHVYRHAL